MLMKHFQIVHLSSLGGKSLEDFIRRAINKLLSPSLQVMFNRTGQRSRPSQVGKIGFNECLEEIVFKAAVSLFPEKTSEQIETRTSKFLRDAKKRIKHTAVIDESFLKQKRKLNTFECDLN